MSQVQRRYRLPRRIAVVPVAVVATLGLFVTACGGGDGGEGGGGAAASPAATSSGATPKLGGTLTFGEFSAPVGLDPIVMTGAGVTGLIETTAVFDTLMRYDYDTGKYVGGTAESATPNTDSTVWTITLRPGITFTDGTSYDAAAVVFSLNRFRAGSPGAPACAEVYACPGPATVKMGSYIKDVSAVDNLTVKVTLTLPWASFPVVLSSEPGLVPSPTALKKCDPAAPANQCAFNTAPVGAGPFMVTSFKPGEAITMVRNPNYWGGQVYLDGLRFISQRDGGGAKTLDALQTGQTQAAFLRDPVAVAAAHKAGLAGISSPAHAGTALLMNTAPTASTSNLKVRQAVLAAVDPTVVNQRAWQGDGHATAQLFTPDFPWYPAVPGPTYDPAAAKKLVDEAKASGWDGTVRLLANNSPSSTNAALAIQAMLQNAGITVNLDSSKDTAAATALLIRRDFDIFLGGITIGNDDTAILALAQNFLSTSQNNYVSISDLTLDQGLREVFAASTDAAKKAAYRTVAQQLVDQAPVMPLATVEEFIAWSPQVHGLVRDVRTSVHLDKAWLG